MIEHKFPNTGGGGFPQKLVNLPDVSYTSLVTGQVPVYNSSTTKFDISTLNAGYIGSLDLASKTNGYVLTWNTTTNTLDLQSLSGAIVWGGISGTLSNQTDLNTALGLKAPIASPTFTGTVGGITSSMVGLGNVDNTSNATERAATATLTNKTLDNTTTLTIKAANLTIQDGTDIAKQAKFVASGIATANTRNITLQDADITMESTAGSQSKVDTHASVTATHGATGAIVGTTNTQTLTNKTLTSPVVNSPTGIVKGDVGLGNVDNTSNATERAATATLTNKTLDNTTTLTIKAANLTIQDGTDIAKQAKFVASGIATANTRNITLQDADITMESTAGSQSKVDTHASVTATHGATGAVVGTTNSQTLTNKTLTSPVVNSPTGIVKGDVGLGNVDNTSDATKNAASVTLTNKSLSDSTTFIIDNTDATKRLTLDVTGNTTNITGTIATAFTTAKTLTLPDATDTLVAKNTTDTLTNKTLDNTNAITIKDTSFTIQSVSDATKQVQLIGNTGQTASTTISIVFPAGGTKLVGDDTTQKLTNKAIVDNYTTDTDGATITFSMATSNVHYVQLGGDRTLATSNLSTGQRFTLILQQDVTGSRLVTWFAPIEWAGATAPTLTITAFRKDIFEFLWDGVTYVELKRNMDVG